MKFYKVLPFLLLLSFTNLLALQEYVVLHVYGSVVSSALPLKTGDKLTADQKVVFSEKSSFVVVTKGGKFNVTAPVSASVNQEVLVSQCALLPLKSSISSTREEDLPVSDIAAYFGDSVFVFVGEKLHLKLNEALTPGEEHFLIYRFKYKGQTVSTRISHDKGIVALDKKHLYTTMEKVLIPADSVESVDILNYVVSTRSITKLVTFRALWLNEELKPEISTLKNFYKMQGLADDLISKELISYVHAVYGKTDEVALRQWAKHL